MANLQIKGIEDRLYEKIKRLAAEENRSMSQHVLFLIKQYLSTSHHLLSSRTPAQTLLELSGSWLDDRDADEIIVEIKKARRNSTKLQKGF